MAESKISSNSRTWHKLIDASQEANQALDSTIAVTLPPNCTEMMYTIQRASNGRTIASTIVPIIQFNSAGAYAMGAYTLHTGIMKDANIVVVNGVAIDNIGAIEVACNACPEALKHRIFAR